MLTDMLFIAAGGALGAVSRYLVAAGAQRLFPPSFPVGTLIVNLAGCFLLGFLGTLCAGPLVLRDAHRLALLVGFLGAFTTFSTYGHESYTLWTSGQGWLALANIAANNLAGLALVALGYRLAQSLAAV